MSLLPRALLWNRLDGVGTDLCLLDDRHDRLVARGTAAGAWPVAHLCRYELDTGDGFLTHSLFVETEGAGWRRQVRLERSTGHWRITASEQGQYVDRVLAGIEEPFELDDVVDVDLQATALTNTLPIRRLGLLGKPAGTSETVAVAWVRVPSLEVVYAEQTYTVLGDGKIRFDSPTFTADLSVDADGVVTHYPGYATLVEQAGVSRA
jgi:hypothetical protein